MELKIRNYDEKDAQAILDIINYNIVNSTALYDYTIRTLDDQSEILKEKLVKGFPVLVAYFDTTLVGFGYYSEFRFREAYKFTVEHSVYVLPTFTGKGVGKQLLEELIVCAQKQNLHTMIGVIDSENESSIAFHEKFGFEIVGNIKESGYKFDRWLHSIILQKML
jgi:phosphinothricin acetyltransferase